MSAAPNSAHWTWTWSDEPAALHASLICTVSIFLWAASAQMTMHASVTCCPCLATGRRSPMKGDDT